MTTQSEAWKSLSNGCPEVVSDEDLMQAYAEINNAIHGLKRMGRIESMTALTEWSRAIEEIQSDRQAANRPKLLSNVRLHFSDGQVTFYGLPGGSWAVDASEQTEQLRKQLEAVYETTTMVKR